MFIVAITFSRIAIGAQWSRLEAADLAQHAVDAVADAEELLRRLEVDVRGALFHRIREQGVDQHRTTGWRYSPLSASRLRWSISPVSISARMPSTDSS